MYKKNCNLSNWLLTYVTLFQLITFSSCISNPESAGGLSSTEKSYPYHVNLIEGLNKRVEHFNLSDIADSIRFVQLEATEECLIGDINEIELDGDDLFIYTVPGQKSSYYFRFNTKGDFLNTIGRIGRGPSEYLHSSFSLDIEKKKIIIFRWYGGAKDFISFNYDGTYSGKCAYPRQPFDGVSKFAILSGSRLLLQDFGYLENRGKLSYNSISSDLKFYKIYDSTGYLINSIPHPITRHPLEAEKTYQSGLSLNSDISFFKGSARMSGQDHDTSYMIRGDSILPAYIFHKGDLNPKFNQRYAQNIGGDEGKYLTSVFPIYETEEFMFRRYFLSGTDQNFMFRYNKLTGFVDSQSPASGFRDDISGGPNIHLRRPTNKSDNVWIRVVQAKEFKDDYGNVTHPVGEKYKRFYNNRIEVAETTKEEDNPIVIIVYLKKTE